MSKYSIESIISKAEIKESNDLFQLANPFILEITVKETNVIMPLETLVAYNGNVKFEKEATFNKGFGNLYKKKLIKKETSMMKVSGAGKIYVANSGRRIKVLELKNESININTENILAYEESLIAEIHTVQGPIGSNSTTSHVNLNGTGLVSIAAHKEPLILLAKPGNPIFTTPGGVIAWSDNLTITLKVAEVSTRAFVSRDTDEILQVKFDGDGWIMIQAHEKNSILQE